MGFDSSKLNSFLSKFDLPAVEDFGRGKLVFTTGGGGGRAKVVEGFFITAYQCIFMKDDEATIECVILVGHAVGGMSSVKLQVLEGEPSASHFPAVGSPRDASVSFSWDTNI